MSKRIIKTLNVSFFVLVFFMLCNAPISYSQTLPSTDDTRIRASEAPQPGWSNGAGSCDTSNDSVNGVNGNYWQDRVKYPPPTPGHSYFLSCASHTPGGESAIGIVSGLTIGETYSFSFFVAGFETEGQGSNRPGNSYRIVIGDDDSGVVNYTFLDWTEQTFTFTANDTSETIEVFGSTTQVSVTHFSFGSDAVRLSCNVEKPSFN